MALGATIHRCELQVSDLDRSYYNTHTLTIAQHPSETDQRMMARLLAFALHADEGLSFTRGLSQEDEPDLWRMSADGRVIEWIETGQPDEKRLRKASAKSEQVTVLCYQPRAARVWWKQVAAKLERLDNLSVFLLPEDASEHLGDLASRNMSLQCTIQEDQIWLSDADYTLDFALDRLR
jgi:uncharacterized protein YaeQ